MKVLKQDRREGIIKLLPQNLDDLWHLFNLVDPGNLVRASTLRRQEAQTDKIRPERGEKVRVNLALRVQDREFDEFIDRLRIHGVIEEGPMDHGSHHTLNVQPGDAVEIVKEWQEADLRRIQEAVEATDRPLVVLVALDDEEALVARMHHYGLQVVAEITAPRGGKMYGQEAPSKEAYFQEIVEAVQRLNPPQLAVLGPGFTREDFLRYGREAAPELFEDAHSVATGHTGMPGIQEALRGGLAEKVLEESRVGQETRAVEQLLEEIGKEGLYAYGPGEVATAARAGAVETLLVTDAQARTAEAEELMREVEEKRGRVLVVSTRHDAGRKLKSLGGLGALLRYPLR